MFILQNWRPLKIGGPRRLPSLPNGRTGPALSPQQAPALPLLPHSHGLMHGVSRAGYNGHGF